MSIPERIGAYPIERELGRGGMGIVYLGRDVKLGRPVAIKVLPDVFSADPERLARFEREAKLLASLSHPNIAGIYGLEEDGARRFLALEYVEGPTLAERLARGALPVDEALDIGRQIAAALEAAHDAGIIHRDLKPGNVKLTPAGDVKVLDFGLARGGGTAEPASDISNSPTLAQSPTLGPAPTAAGVILGTAAYMSPEQARGRTLDRRTDIWSFGCVLYELFTGTRLFDGETVSDIIARILEREPDWSVIPAAVPERVRDLVRRCLEKDARRRLRDIGDARIELEDVVAARTSRSRVVAAEVEAARRGARGRAPVIAYAVAGLALLVAAGSWVRPWLRTEARHATRLAINAPRGLVLENDAISCAISPDGASVVFVANDSAARPQLWARSLESVDARPLPGTEYAAKPFWSPDSRWIGFFAEGKLKKSRLDGTGTEVVCEAPNGRGGAWSDRGTIVFAPVGEGPLAAVSASGGQPRQVTTLDSTRRETAHRFPCFLPDQQRFLYVVLPGTPRGFEVRVGSLDGGPGRLLFEADGAPVYADPGYLIYPRGQSLVAQRFDSRALKTRGDPVVLPDATAGSNTAGSRAATVSRTGTLAYVNGMVTNTRLTWFDRTGRALGTVPLPAGQYGYPGITPDGRTMVVTRAAGPNESDLWLVDLERGASTRFTYGPRANSFGIFSPDGERIAFESDRNGPFDIYVKPVSGVTPEVALVEGGSALKHPFSWSPDGKWLAYYQMDPATGFDIWLVPTDGSGPLRPYLQTPFQDMFPMISPDGRWMLYVSDESGRPEAYVRSFPTPGRKFQVTTAGCYVAAWRRDQKELFFLGLDGRSILAAEVLESGADFRSAAPKLLFRAPGNVLGWTGTRDGQRALIALPEGRSEPVSLTVTLDWMASVEAREAERR